MGEDGAVPQLSVLFDNPPSERMHQLEKELRELRAKCVIQELELSRVQAEAAERLDIALNTIREQTEGEIQRLQTELSDANNRLALMSDGGDNMIKAKNRQISTLEDDHRDMMEKVKHDANEFLNESLNSLQNVNEIYIENAYSWPSWSKK